MGRYTGPKHKLARREGINILDKISPSLQRRVNIPPGIHGKKGRRRVSEYGHQLREKQKVKVIYGLREKQLKNLVNQVQKKKGETGEMIFSLLERRLDNVVFRLGFAKTRFQARQLVSHRHVLVNGKKVNIPSYIVKKDDTVSLSPKLDKNLVLFSSGEEKQVPPFLKKGKKEGKLARYPQKGDLEVPFDIQLIIEYYSR